jgi:hypothetical protein
MGFEPTWLSDTVPEPDELPPQATSKVDIKQRQTIPVDARVTRCRARAGALEGQQACEEMCFILEYTLNSIKQRTDHSFTVR